MFLDDGYGYGDGGNRGGDADNSGVDSNYIETVVVLEGSGRWDAVGKVVGGGDGDGASGRKGCGSGVMVGCVGEVGLSYIFLFESY